MNLQNSILVKLHYNSHPYFVKSEWSKNHINYVGIAHKISFLKNELLAESKAFIVGSLIHWDIVQDYVKKIFNHVIKSDILFISIERTASVLFRIDLITSRMKLGKIDEDLSRASVRIRTEIHEINWIERRRGCEIMPEPY